VDKEQIYKSLKGHLDLLPNEAVFEHALRSIVGEKIKDKGWIKANFSRLIHDIQAEAYRYYLSLEEPASAEALSNVFSELFPEKGTREDYVRILSSATQPLGRFYLGIIQGRKPRAGKAFEQSIYTLFNALEYPYTPQPIINGQPDFLLPSVKHYRVNAMDCIIFTVKRTLRERWRQIISEGTRGHMFFLATIDEDVAKRDLPEMLHNRIYLVMPEDLRASTYADQQNALSFEVFFRDYLDPAMLRWKHNSVIK